jgi:hypothetical protein
MTCAFPPERLAVVVAVPFVKLAAHNVVVRTLFAVSRVRSFPGVPLKSFDCLASTLHVPLEQGEGTVATLIVTVRK